MKNFQNSEIPQWGLILFLFFLALTSCVTSKTELTAMNTWIGSSKASLYRSWGPPSRNVNDGNGGEIAIYENSSSGTINNGFINPNQNNIQTFSTSNTITTTKQKMMYIDKNGKIYECKYFVNGREQKLKTSTGGSYDWMH